MHIVGDYKIVNNNIVGVACQEGEPQPYLFIHRAVGVLTEKTEVTIIPTKPHLSHILDGLTTAPAPDGMFLWFCCATHPRFRLQRHLSTNAIAISTGEWGSTVIAIGRADLPAKLVFKKGISFETATLEQGVILRSMEQREAI